MHNEMILQVDFSRSSVVAVRALEGHHAAMHAGVLSKIAFQSEPHSALATFEGLLTRVYKLVPLEST